MQPKKKTRKMRHTSNRFILHSARERVTENRSKFQWALPGATLCQMKGQVNYITTVLRPVMVTGQTQPADGRRRKTTGSRPTVAKITTRRNTKLAEETEIGDTTGLQPMYENGASYTNGWYVGAKYQHNNAHSRADQKQDKMKSQLLRGYIVIRT